METSERQRRITNVALLVLAAVAVGFVLYWLRAVMVPFVLALLLAYGIAPIVDLQQRRLRVPRPLAIATALALSVLLLVAAGSLVSRSVTELSANISSYQQKIEQLIDEASKSDLAQRLDLGLEGEVDLRSLIPTDQLGSILVGTTNAIVDLLSKGLLVLIFLFFLLMGESRRPVAETGVRAEVQQRIRRYIVLQGLISMATGVLVGGVLALLDVPLAMVFGLLAFLLNFIPSIGSIIATLLPLPVVLVSPEVGFSAAVLAIAIPAAIQLVIGNVITPKIMGDSLDLDPVVILLALMVWGALWGVVGMILATPITAVMKMLFERLEITAPVARVMSGRFGEAREA